MFKVWQDINQDGISDEGKLLTLEQAGIKEINLDSDNIITNPQSGVTELGRATYLKEDGSEGILADVIFNYTNSQPVNESSSTSESNFGQQPLTTNVDLSNVQDTNVSLDQTETTINYELLAQSLDTATTNQQNSQVAEISQINVEITGTEESNSVDSIINQITNQNKENY